MSINLTGTWKLDANRSESMLPYLSALVCITLKSFIY